MNKFILDSYVEISNLTYYIFEIHHMFAVKSLTNGQLFSKDFMILVTLNQNPSSSPTDVAKAVQYESSALSNRLRFLEDSGYIIRKHSDDEKRGVSIFITQKGKTVAEKYDEYHNKFLMSLKKSLSIKELILLRSISLKLKSLLIANELSYSYKQNESINSQLLSQFQNYLFSFENDFIEESAIDLKQNDLFILTEFYVYFQKGRRNLTDFSIYLHIPYQTLVSKIKKFIEQKYIIKTNRTLKLTNEIQHTVEKFMLLRTTLYYKTMHTFNTNEQKIIKKLFLMLKEHAQTYIK